MQIPSGIIKQELTKLTFIQLCRHLIVRISSPALINGIQLVGSLVTLLTISQYIPIYFVNSKIFLQNYDMLQNRCISLSTAIVPVHHTSTQLVQQTKHELVTCMDLLCVVNLLCIVYNMFTVVTSAHGKIVCNNVCAQ